MESIGCVISKCNSLEKAIIYQISIHGPLSKLKLLKLLDLKHATMFRAVDSLIKKGLLVQIAVGESSNVGRKPKLLSINPSSFYFFGVDISRMHLGIILADACLQTVEYLEYELSGSTSPEFIIDKISDSVTFLLKKHAIDRNLVLGLGVGAVGKLKKSEGIIVYADNFGTEWSDIHIKERLENQLGIPVLLENGANSAAFAEFMKGSASSFNHVLFVSMGVGVRCGVINDGKIIQNINNIDSAYGHIVIEPSGKKCNCGNYGCMVMYATTRPIIEEYKKACKLYNSSFHPDVIDNIGFKDIVDLSEKNDITAVNILTNAAVYMGIGLANIISILNPEVVVLGGPIVEKCTLYFNKAIEIAKSRIYKIEDRNLTFVRTHFEKEAVSIGICAIMLDQAFNKK